MSAKPAIVDFIIIGAMKSGTTSLVDYLQQNQDLCLSIPKEPQFFSRYFNLWTIEEYEEKWKEPDKICGEASTCYSRWPHYKNVPERIYKYNPRIKLIYILRDPVARAYSHYRHNILIDKLKYSSFDEALSISNEIIMSSMYAEQINQYLAYFPIEQILLIDLDEMIENPISVINKVEGFLGVTQSKKEKLIDLHSNKVGIGAANRQIDKVINSVLKIPVVNAFAKHTMSQQMRKKIRKSIGLWTKKSMLTRVIAYYKSNAIDSLKEYQIRLLSNKFEQDIVELEKVWCRDLTHWKH